MINSLLIHILTLLQEHSKHVNFCNSYTFPFVINLQAFSFSPRLIFEITSRLWHVRRRISTFLHNVTWLTVISVSQRKELSLCEQQVEESLGMGCGHSKINIYPKRIRNKSSRKTGRYFILQAKFWELLNVVSMTGNLIDEAVIVW